MRLPVVVPPVERGEAWPATKSGMGKLFRTTPDGYRLTAAELAARVGTSVDQILKIQSGVQGMRLRMGLQVARALNRSPWWVLEYSERVQKMAAGRREVLRQKQRDRRARMRRG